MWLVHWNDQDIFGFRRLLTPSINFLRQLATAHVHRVHRHPISIVREKTNIYCIDISVGLVQNIDLKIY